MKRLVHKGLRPEYKLTELKRVGINVLYIERRPDGSFRYWNERQLNEGCGEEIEDTSEKLLYCRKCKEWYSRSHYE